MPKGSGCAWQYEKGSEDGRGDYALSRVRPKMDASKNVTVSGLLDRYLENPLLPQPLRGTL